MKLILNSSLLHRGEITIAGEKGPVNLTQS